MAGLCERHWSELREGIKAAGLYHLVAQGAEELRIRMENDPLGDPLLAAHNLIVQNILMTPLGLESFMDREGDCPRCPLCFVIKSCNCGRGETCHFLEWTKNAVDNVRQFFKPAAQA